LFCIRPIKFWSFSMAIAPAVLIVPGLRDHVDTHWQTLLAKKLSKVKVVPPMGREDLGCAKRVAAIEEAVSSMRDPVLIVAHSGGCITVAHWALSSKYLDQVCGAVLAVPPDFETPMPEGYPSISALNAGAWLPVPRQRLPFRSLVCTSRNDPLASGESAQKLAKCWQSEIIDLGEVGHLNPASGYGEWPMALELIQRLSVPAL
jgi:predicted alpha/beta hydrolase family esterase